MDIALLITATFVGAITTTASFLLMEKLPIGTKIFAANAEPTE